MPVIIDSPEAWFRTQQRDLHVIDYRKKPDFYDLDDRDKIRLRIVQDKNLLKDWFKTHLPTIALSVIGPSEYSGWIEGGPRYLTADFDSAGLSLFEASWDENSLWKIEVWPFSGWKRRLDSARLLTAPLTVMEKLRWWDTPQGMLLVSAYTDEPGYCENGLLSLEDGWWKLQQIYPEFSGLPANTFPCGTFWPERYKGAPPFVFVEFVWDQTWDSEDYIAHQDNGQRLKKALGVPDDVKVTLELEDF